MTSPGRERLIVCDASPLILLAKIEQAPLLLQVADEVWVPDTVWDEITQRSGTRAEIPELVRLFASCVRTADPALQAAYEIQVDAGEAAALALAARNPGSCLLMDDRRGRLLAAQQGLRAIGTLGLLLRAKGQGRVPLLKPLLLQLRARGMFLSPHLESEVLSAAGE